MSKSECETSRFLGWRRVARPETTLQARKARGLEVA